MTENGVKLSLGTSSYSYHFELKLTRICGFVRIDSLDPAIMDRNRVKKRLQLCGIKALHLLHYHGLRLSFNRWCCWVLDKEFASVWHIVMESGREGTWGVGVLGTSERDGERER